MAVSELFILPDAKYNIYVRRHGNVMKCGSVMKYVNNTNNALSINDTTSLLKLTLELLLVSIWNPTFSGCILTLFKDRKL